MMRNNYKISNALVISVVVSLVNVLLAGNLSPEVVQAKSIVAGVGVGVSGGQDVGAVHVGVAVGGGDGVGGGICRVDHGVVGHGIGVARVVHGQASVSGDSVDGLGLRGGHLVGGGLEGLGSIGHGHLAVKGLGSVGHAGLSLSLGHLLDRLQRLYHGGVVEGSHQRRRDGWDGPGAGDVVAAVPVVGQGEGVGVDVTHGVLGVVGEWQRIGVGGSGQAVEVVDGHVGLGQAGVGGDRLDSSLGDLLDVSLGERLGSVRDPRDLGGGVEGLRGVSDPRFGVGQSGCQGQGQTKELIKEEILFVVVCVSLSLSNFNKKVGKFQESDKIRKSFVVKNIARIANAVQVTI